MRNPEASNYCLQLGTNMANAGRFLEAIVAYQDAVKYDPRNAIAWSNLSSALLGIGRTEDARGAAQKALRIAPGMPEALCNLSVAQMGAGDYADSEEAARRALRLRPDMPAALANLAAVLQHLGRAHEAIEIGQKAVEKAPDSPQVWANLSAAYLEVGNPHAAVSAGAHAADLAPGFSGGAFNLANAMRAAGRLDDAIGWYRKALLLQPDYAEGRTNLAQALLAAGRWDEGWKEYEARWGIRGVAQGYLKTDKPQWRGEPCEGMTIFIYNEQGLGDTIQFCRYAPLVAGRGALVVLRVQASLVRLLAESFSGIAGISVISTDDPIPPFDYHCPIMSLPLAFGTTEATVPAHPYLKASPNVVAAIVKPLRVGLAWEGNPYTDRPRLSLLNSRRSIALERLVDLPDVPGTTFFSLQKDGSGRAGGRMIDLMREVTDFDDTASIIAGLDLVISVDTSVAHLAGAMGKPVWMLDRFDPCWRWMLGREDTPWYPTMRIFRQERPGDWGGVIQRVVSELRAVCASLSKHPRTSGAQNALSPLIDPESPE